MKLNIKLPRLKLPGFSPGTASDTSLVRLGVAVVVAGALALGVMVLFYNYAFVAMIERGRQAQIDIVVQSLASNIETPFVATEATMDRLVSDPTLIDLMAANDASRRATQERLLANYFPGALRVRLLPPGLEEVDNKAPLQLGYACLDLLHEAERKEAPPPAEVHAFGQAQQHIDIARRIVSATGRHAVGDLLVSYPVSMNRQLLDKLKNPAGHIEIWQPAQDNKHLVIASRGTSLAGDEAVPRVLAIAGTRWQLAYWPGALISGAGSGGLWREIAVFVLLTGLFAGAVLVLMRVFAAALRGDLVSIINIVKDIGEGKVRREYPVRVADCKGTVELLTRMARELSVAPPTHSMGSGAPVLASTSLPVAAIPAAANVAVDPTIFRAYDIRGVVGQSLTPPVVFEIGRAIGSEAAARGQQGVIVARDGRLSGPELAEALTKGLRASGMNVTDVGRVPTPLLYFATHYLDSTSGVMLTGSHNPPDYNGLKIVLGGETLSGDDIQGLHARITTRNYSSGAGALQSVDVTRDYIERVTSDVRVARPMRVVVDCGNGVAGEIAPRLLRALGCEVSELYCDIDGHFPNHHPDPSRPENLRDLIKAVQEQSADVGFAFDGDGDRLGVISSGGKIIWPDRVLMLLAMDVLARHPGAEIIYDVKCSRHLDRIIREHGGKPLMWKTGHSLIKRKMRETGALLAGEMSGHTFFKERWFGFDDGLYTAARLLEVLSNDPRVTHKVFAALPDSVNTPELNVRMVEGEQHAFMQRLLAQARFEKARISTIDGLRADFEDGWGLVRASNTTPSLVLRFEADDDAGLRRIQEQFRSLLLELEPGLKLPF